MEQTDIEMKKSNRPDDAARVPTMRFGPATSLSGRGRPEFT
jgi:hypothetical protein